MSHLQCMDLIFMKAGVLTHGACWIELRCLKRLFSPAVPPDALLQGVWQKSWWQCWANLEAWVNDTAGCVLGHRSGWWFVLRNGNSGNAVSWTHKCLLLLQLNHGGIMNWSYGQTVLFTVSVWMEVCCAELFQMYFFVCVFAFLSGNISQAWMQKEGSWVCLET